LPQTAKQKFNIGDNTKDVFNPSFACLANSQAIFIDAERRFKQLEQETKKLNDDSKKYQDAINGTIQMLSNLMKAC